jgi:hypothetical protein
MIRLYGEEVILFILRAAADEHEFVIQLLFDEMPELRSVPNLASLLLKVFEVIWFFELFSLKILCSLKEMFEIQLIVSWN